MKILQRRVKSRTLTKSVVSGPIAQYQNLLWSRWLLLSPRDQLALGALMVFLLLFIGGYGGYSVHQAATDSKADYQEQVADYFWLRAQAGNIDSTMNTATAQDGVAMPPASSVNATLNSSGIDNAQVIAAGDAVQLSFNYPSQAIVSSALAQLEQQGWQFTQLSMQQDVVTKSIQVQATVTP
ncbi:type II secretion system protein M [Psychrobacter frigidicola]|uniref:Type II secretion system protein M n=1 Tax=Psychrobacter frigidicola TaxID=45611 RepID=A0A5C7A532_9GAMM|nr:type II secretion system protein GspM [Psychrobacter frigidicola]TXD97710.1 type II secretion system protein M [Psychrobacter frigidicola]